jgi:hypothetical protein
MFQIINITKLYELERQKSVDQIIAEFGNYTVATGITVTDYYGTLAFYRKAKKVKKARAVLPIELELA